MDARPWNGPGQDFDRFDAVILRSNWDYHHAVDAFAGWLDGLGRAGVSSRSRRPRPRPSLTR